MRPLLPSLPLLFVFAAPVHAAGPELGIADDRVLLAGGADADKPVLEWQEHGIQTVRIYALWSRLAPSSPRATTPGASSTAPWGGRGRRHEADPHHHRPRAAVGEPPLGAR